MTIEHLCELVTCEKGHTWRAKDKCIGKDPECADEGKSFQAEGTKALRQA